jgi:HAD superfamily hydrolase (TIGR01549 family)
MIKGLAFDFDGVLFESVPIKTRAFQALFEGETPEILEVITRYHLANGGINRWDKIRTIFRDILHRPLSEHDLKQQADRFAALVVQKVVAAPWVIGAKEFLDGHQKQYRYFVVSATPEEELKEIVRQKKIGHYFREILGAPRKKDASLREILERHALAPAELVYVGDAINDWQAARSLSIPFVWRRAAEDVPMLPGYDGSWLSTLDSLDECLLNR